MWILKHTKPTSTTKKALSILARWAAWLDNTIVSYKSFLMVWPIVFLSLPNNWTNLHTPYLIYLGLQQAFSSHASIMYDEILPSFPYSQ